MNFPGESHLKPGEHDCLGWISGRRGSLLRGKRRWLPVSPSPALTSSQGTSSTLSVTPTHAGKYYKFKREGKKKENCDGSIRWNRSDAEHNSREPEECWASFSSSIKFSQVDGTQYFLRNPSWPFLHTFYFPPPTGILWVLYNFKRVLVEFEAAILLKASNPRIHSLTTNS